MAVPYHTNSLWTNLDTLCKAFLTPSLGLGVLIIPDFSRALQCLPHTFTFAARAMRSSHNLPDDESLFHISARRASLPQYSLAGRRGRVESHRPRQPASADMCCLWRSHVSTSGHAQACLTLIPRQVEGSNSSEDKAAYVLDRRLWFPSQFRGIVVSADSVDPSYPRLALPSQPRRFGVAFAPGSLPIILPPHLINLLLHLLFRKPQIPHRVRCHQVAIHTALQVSFAQLAALGAVDSTGGFDAS